MESQNLAIVKADEPRELSISRSPHIVLDEAQKAASALKDVLNKKAKKISFNGEQYLEAEDWQTIGKFYNVSAKVEWTKFIEIGTSKGYEARAVVIHIPTGNEISAAEAMCTTDEKNWATPSLNQIRSMAQTRASAKALRTVLAWVVVMAGYKATPAEEIDGAEVVPYQAAPKKAAPGSWPHPADTPPVPQEELVKFQDAAAITEMQEQLAKMNGGIEDLMDAQLKALTLWHTKETNEEKWVKLADLPGIAKRKPAWFKGIQKKVLEEFQKATHAEKIT